MKKQKHTLSKPKLTAKADMGGAIADVKHGTLPKHLSGDSVPETVGRLTGAREVPRPVGKMWLAPERKQKPVSVPPAPANVVDDFTFVDQSEQSEADLLLGTVEKLEQRLKVLEGKTRKPATFTPPPWTSSLHPMITPVSGYDGPFRLYVNPTYPRRIYCDQGYIHCGRSAINFPSDLPGALLPYYDLSAEEPGTYHAYIFPRIDTATGLIDKTDDAKCPGFYADGGTWTSSYYSTLHPAIRIGSFAYNGTTVSAIVQSWQGGDIYVPVRGPNPYSGAGGYVVTWAIVW